MRVESLSEQNAEKPSRKLSAPDPKIQFPKFEPNNTSPILKIMNKKSFLPFENTLKPQVQKNIELVYAHNIDFETQEEGSSPKVKMPEYCLQQDQIIKRMKIKKAPVEISKYNQRVQEEFADILYKPNDIWEA